MTQAVTCRYSDRIKKACAPLFDLFPLSHFGYCKITNSGDFSYFGTHVAWSEYFAAEKLYLNFPFYRHPKYAPVGVKILPAVTNQAYLELMDRRREKFDIHHSLALISRGLNGMEGFVFSTNSSDELHLSALINELPLLRLFIRKFRIDNDFIFQRSEENQVNLVELMGSVFFDQIIEPSSYELKKRIFLKKIGGESEVKLSCREREVIKLVLQGYSPRMIAPQVYLAKRTVEHHIERIKEKLECQTKAELIQKAGELVEFGYLSDNKKAW